MTSSPAISRIKADDSGTEFTLVTVNVYLPQLLPFQSNRLKLPEFIVKPDEDQENSCGPPKARMLEPTIPAPSRLLKPTLMFVQLPFTSTGRELNQNKIGEPPLGVGFPERVKLAVKFAPGPDPVSW